MKSILIYYHLCRSNPAILRSAEVPEVFPPEELSALCCLTLGLTPSEYTCTLCYSPSPDSSRASAPDAVLPGMGGSIHIAPAQQAAGSGFLDVRWKAEEGSGTDPSRPLLVSRTGYQVPRDILSISVINGMQAAFRKDDTWQSPTGRLLHRHQQECDPEKVNNALCRRYAPDQVRPEVNMAPAVSLSDILDSATLDILRDAMEENCLYGYQNTRKALCVAALARALEFHNVDSIFDEMEMDEYLRFRRLALSGSTSCRDDDELQRDFPTLWKHFRIATLRKLGPRISGDVLQDYETWFDQPQEASFRKEKRFRQVMRWCSFTYGAFSLEDCRRILDTFYPGELLPEELEKCWLNPPFSLMQENLLFQWTLQVRRSLEDYAFDENVISSEDSADIAAVFRSDPGQKKIPSCRAAFEAECTRYLNFADGLPEEPEILELQRDCYARDYEVPAAVQKSLCLLRTGTAPEDVIEASKRRAVFWSPYRANSDELDRRYLSFLTRIADDVPLIFYHGFTRKEIREQGIESHLQETLSAYRAEKAEREKAAKAQDRAAARAKKTAAKGGKKK